MESVIKPVAVLRCDYRTKFGIPRQPGIVEDIEGRIIFEEEFADREAIRGIEEFSHLWLIWQFSENLEAGWNPTVRPPRLGGNERRGVFATRSPYRPNALALSCVRLKRIEDNGGGMPVLVVTGADLMDNTPIFDIKPYIPYADSIPDATSGFAPDEGVKKEVIIPEEISAGIPGETLRAIEQILSLDPRPGYKKEGDKIYRFEFSDYRIGFKAEGGAIILTEAERTE